MRTLPCRVRGEARSDGIPHKVVSILPQIYCYVAAVSIPVLWSYSAEMNNPLGPLQDGIALRNDHVGSDAAVRSTVWLLHIDSMM